VKQQPLMNSDICLFLLTQVFLIIHQTKLVTPLAKHLLESNFSAKNKVAFTFFSIKNLIIFFYTINIYIFCLDC